MIERVLSTPWFRLHLVMFCVIITEISGAFRIPTWLENNPPSFEYFRKTALTTIFKKLEEAGTFIFVDVILYANTLKNNVYRSNKREPPPFFHSDTNPVLGHFLIHSVHKTHALFVTVVLIWLLFLNILSFNFFPTPNKCPRFTRFRRSYVNHTPNVLTNRCQK